MAAPGPVSCPAPHPTTESCDLKVLPPRQRPVRYPKESHDPKPLPRSCKAQYSSPKSHEVSHNHPEVDVDTEVEVKRYSNQTDAELEDQRPATPSTPEHEQDDHDRADFHGGADSLDDDSSSDYINNTSDDEEDYDDGEHSVNHVDDKYLIIVTDKESILAPLLLTLSSFMFNKMLIEIGRLHLSD